MKAHRIQTLSLLLVAASLTGCDITYVDGSGHVVSEVRQTPEFRALSVSDGIAATVIVDSRQPQEVRIEGDDNLVGLVRTDLESGGTLHVYFGNGGLSDWSSHHPLRVIATVAALDSVERSGGATVDIRGLSGDSFRLDASGGGDVYLQGTVTRVETGMSGGTRLFARELATRDADLASSGGGSTELRVSDRLRAVASGGGTLRVIGRPSVVAESLSGGSTLRFE